MSFKDPTQPLRDILESVRMIEDFTADMSFEQFREDPKTVAAVERKSLVIGEASVRLGARGIWEICCAVENTEEMMLHAGRKPGGRGGALAPREEECYR